MGTPEKGCPKRKQEDKCEPRESQVGRAGLDAPLTSPDAYYKHCTTHGGCIIVVIQQLKARLQPSWRVTDSHSPGTLLQVQEPRVRLIPGRTWVVTAVGIEGLRRMGFLMKTVRERPGNTVGMKSLRGEMLKPNIVGPPLALLQSVHLVMM